MKFNDLKTLRFAGIFKWDGGISLILPFAGYVLFGLANIYFFSMAIKQVPTAVAFALWTATTLIFLKITEFVFFHQRISMVEIFFMLLIMAGILGLKLYAIPEK